MRQAILRNGVAMPLMGFGTFQLAEGEECEGCVSQALAQGCRLFDTASAYGNEASVGRALARSGVPRQEVFLITKLWLQDMDYDRACGPLSGRCKSWAPTTSTCISSAIPLAITTAPGGHWNAFTGRAGCGPSG